MAAKWIGAWAGGRIRRDQKGRSVYVLERMVSGNRYSKSLGPCDENVALLALAEFEVHGPARFKTQRETVEKVQQDQIKKRDRYPALTLSHMEDFRAHLIDKECSAGYVDYTLGYLADWADALSGRALDELDLGDLRAAMKPWKRARPKRIVAIKAFATYLRQEGLLDRKSDPTLDLVTESAKGNKELEERSYLPEEVNAFYRALTGWKYVDWFKGGAAPEKEAPGVVDLQPVRDVVRVLAYTGMHCTELNRLVAGKGIIRDLKDQGQIAGVLVVLHKKGGGHPYSVDAGVMEAVRRLEIRGSIPNRVYLSRATRRAAKAIGQEDFNLHRLRHTYGTLTANGTTIAPKNGPGVPLEVVSQLMGHNSTKTFKRHYLGLYIPEMSLLPLKLQHPDDP